MTNKDKKNYFESALIAKYFGFKIDEPIEVNKDHIKLAKDARKEKEYLDENLFPIEEAVANLIQYRDETGKESIEPKLTYYEGIAEGPHKKNRKKPNEEIISLHIINADRSIVDATIIKTAVTILNENGIKNICVKINSVGGKEAQNQFYKESTSYYRKHINDLNANCRQYFKQSVFNLIKKGSNQCTNIHQESPTIMDYLGEESRKMFGEILEYLETLNINYEIDKNILGDINYSTHTVFEIIDLDSKKIVASGSHYNLLAKKIGLKRDIGAMGAIIRINNPKKITAIALNKVDKAKVFFMQIGYAAKLKALKIIDDLRKENIPLKQKVYKDKLTSQIASAKKERADYILIMGQKEAIEDTLILRDKDSRNQYIIKRADLAKRIKEL